jgi:hypothetical protein
MEEESSLKTYGRETWCVTLCGLLCNPTQPNGGSDSYFRCLSTFILAPHAFILFALLAIPLRLPFCCTWLSCEWNKIKTALIRKVKGNKIISVRRSMCTWNFSPFTLYVQSWSSSGRKKEKGLKMNINTNA